MLLEVLFNGVGDLYTMLFVRIFESKKKFAPRPHHHPVVAAHHAMGPKVFGHVLF
jgi:hypothetical protein